MAGLRDSALNPKSLPEDEGVEKNPVFTAGAAADLDLSWEEEVDPNPPPTTRAEDEAGLLSRLLFLWVWPFLTQAYETTMGSHLKLKDLHPMSTSEELSANTERLKNLWDEQTQLEDPCFAVALAWFLFKPWGVSFFLIGLVTGAYLSTPVMMGQVIAARTHCPSHTVVRHTALICTGGSGYRCNQR